MWCGLGVIQHTVEELGRPFLDEPVHAKPATELGRSGTLLRSCLHTAELFITANVDIDVRVSHLCVSFLPLQQLADLLAPYGNVVSSRVLRDSNGKSRGVGFARCGIA